MEEGEREAGPFRASRGGDVEVKQLLIYIIQKTNKRKRGTCNLRMYGGRLKQARLRVCGPRLDWIRFYYLYKIGRVMIF